MHDNFLSKDDFNTIYSRVPRAVVDVCIVSGGGIVLARRKIEPNSGKWNLPGGTVYMRESLLEAATRIAQKETGLSVEIGVVIGAMEFLSEERHGYPNHSISTVVIGTPIGGELTHDETASKISFFTEIPADTVPEHALFIQAHRRLLFGSA